MTITTGRLAAAAFDAPDIERQAAFYAEFAGWETISKDDDWITMRMPDGHEVAFQLAPDHVAPRWPGQELPHSELPGWPTARPGSRWLIQQDIRSTCASGMGLVKRLPCTRSPSTRQM